MKEALGADAQVEDSYEFEIKQKEASETKRYESAFKELVGFEMGQVVVSDSGSKDIVLKQPYRYFKDCELMYEAGRVYGAKLKFISEKNYSQKSLEQEARTTSKDVARRFDITYSDSVTDLWWRFPGAYPIGDFSAMAWTNDWAFCVSGGSGDTRILLIIRNDALHERLKRQRTEKEEAQKATLPVFGTGKQE